MYEWGNRWNACQTRLVKRVAGRRACKGRKGTLSPVHKYKLCVGLVGIRQTQSQSPSPSTNVWKTNKKKKKKISIFSSRQSEKPFSIYVNVKYNICELLLTFYFFLALLRLRLVVAVPATTYDIAFVEMAARASKYIVMLWIYRTVFYFFTSVGMWKQFFFLLLSFLFLFFFHFSGICLFCWFCLCYWWNTWSQWQSQQWQNGEMVKWKIVGSHNTDMHREITCLEVAHSKCFLW